MNNNYITKLKFSCIYLKKIRYALGDWGKNELFVIIAKNVIIL